ncbi:MAG TPA: NfeD family protein [Candidatus Dormibacteraeota bacterium]|nr:NfeD family protein [Candidatus Dormibacteraeota bacterium]
MGRAPIVGAVLAIADGSLGSHLSPVVANPTAQLVSHHAGIVGVLANPTLAFVLLLMAMLAVGLEVVHPGTLVFGALGLVAGALAIVGLANQPVDWVGLVLVGSAAALLVVDTSLHSHGLISLAGVVAAVSGGLLLYNTAPGQGGVSLFALITVPVVLGGVWITLSRRALRVRHLPFGSSSHELLGLTAIVRQRADPDGAAAVEGELWRINARSGGPLEVGAEVEVIAQDGLTLIVEPLPGPTTASATVAAPGARAGAHNR